MVPPDPTSPSRADAAASSLRIGTLTLDPVQRRLRIGDREVEVERKVFDLLHFLAQRPGVALSKDELLSKVWRRNIASDTVIAQAVHKARRVLADAGLEDSLVTLHGVGYRFDAPVTLDAPAVPHVHPPTATTQRPRAAVLLLLLLVMGGAIASLVWWIAGRSPAVSLVAIMPAYANTATPGIAWLEQSAHLVLGRRLERRGTGSVVATRLTREVLEPLDPAGDKAARIAAARRLVPYVVVPTVESVDGGYAIHADVHGPDGVTRFSARGVDPIRVADALGIQLVASLRAGSGTTPLIALSEVAFANEAYARGLVALEEGRANEARDLLAAAVSQDGAFIAAQYELAIAERDAGRYADAIAAFTRLAGLANSRGDPWMSARIANALAVAWFQRGELVTAEEHWHAARRQYLEAGDSGGVALLDLALAISATNRGRFEEAEQLADAALDHFRRVDDRARVADVLNQFGVIAWRRHDVDQSLGFHQQALAIRRDLGLLRRASASINNIATTREYQGDWDAARRDYEEALAIRRNLGDRPGQISTLLNLVRLETRKGRLGTAQGFLSDAEPLIAQVGDRYRAALAQHYRADLDAAAGRVAQAAPAMLASAEALATQGYAADAVEVQIGAANLYLEAGDPARARQLADTARQTARADVPALRHALAALDARLLSAMGDHAGARTVLASLVENVVEPDLRSLRAQIASELGFSCLRAGDMDGAIRAVAVGMAGTPPPVEAHLLQVALAKRRGDDAAVGTHMAAARERAGEAWRTHWAALLVEFAPEAEGGN